MLATAGPDVVVWGVTEQLLALIADELAVGNWQRQGNAKAPKPKPVQRPGVKEPGTRIGGEARPLDELSGVLAAWRRGEGVTSGS